MNALPCKFGGMMGSCVLIISFLVSRIRALGLFYTPVWLLRMYCA
jgi:hypothetical protein